MHAENDVNNVRLLQHKCTTTTQMHNNNIKIISEIFFAWRKSIWKKIVEDAFKIIQYVPSSVSWPKVYNGASCTPVYVVVCNCVRVCVCVSEWMSLSTVSLFQRVSGFARFSGSLEGKNTLILQIPSPFPIRLSRYYGLQHDNAAPCTSLLSTLENWIGRPTYIFFIARFHVITNLWLAHLRCSHEVI